MTAKESAARRAVEYVTNGMIVGLGTGSTARFAIEALGRRVAEGLLIRGVPTSLETERLAREMGIPVAQPADLQGSPIDVTIDGADEVDPQFRLIKGGGGALVREKLVASASREMIVMVEERKLVPVLGAFPLPVAIVPFALPFTLSRLKRFSPEVSLRTNGDQPFVTDDGLYVADLKMGRIEDPDGLAAALLGEPGVVDTGLFLGLATRIVVGYENGRAVEQTLPGK